MKLVGQTKSKELASSTILGLQTTPSCMVTFEKENKAQNHMDTGVHKLFLERETLHDSVKRTWAQHATEKASQTTLCANYINPSAWYKQWKRSPHFAGMGTKRSATNTSENVKRFPIAKFNEDLRGQKAKSQRRCRKLRTRRVHLYFCQRTGKWHGK